MRISSLPMPGPVPESARGELETLIGVRIAYATIHFRVATNGCTAAEHFRVEIEHGTKEPEATKLSLYRTTRDECKGYFPEGTEIAFDRDALGLPRGSAIVVRNPFGGG